ncbi:MAG: hypothetical protein, partial [Olavius algarvensis Gamma 1 endosymbiont]
PRSWPNSPSVCPSSLGSAPTTWPWASVPARVASPLWANNAHRP